MSTNWGNYDISTFGGYSDDFDLTGLEKFKNKLEKHFFATVAVRKCITEREDIELVIEVSGTIDFALVIQHFRIDILSNPGVNSNFLMNCLLELQEANTESIDIKELSFLMSDTSIFIQQVCEYGVAQQLDNIMRLVMNDYNYIVSRLNEVPSEIHIPVFEDVDRNSDSLPLLSNFAQRTTEKDYFTYWGLTFDSVRDTVIYDVEKSNFIFEELCYVYD